MDINWDLLIENHFKDKKEKKETLSLNTLMESISEVMIELEAKDDYLLTEDAKSFSMSIPIPRLVPSEAWGDPSSQSRKEVDRVFASVTRKGGDMKGRIAHVATFLDPAQAVKKAPGGKVNTILNMMQIIEALQAALNDFNESSAGFVFEGFMAALTGGRQEADRVGGTLPIEDFVTADEVNVSLKLLSPNTPIHGSFTNLVDYLFIRGGNGVPSIKYLIAYKDSEDHAVAKLSFWDFLISRENFVDLMIKSGNSNLFGSVAAQMKQHIASHQESNEWKLTMKQLLLQTSGYNQKLGMFVKNLTDEGEFFIGAETGPDPAIKNRQYQLMLKQGRISDLKDAAEEEGAKAAKSGGPTFQDWIGDLDLTELPRIGLKTRTEFDDDMEFFWNRGFESVSKEEEVTESYFGTFHESEKRHMKEELLLEAGRGGEGKKSQFSISRGGMSAIKRLAGTTSYGELDMSQGNIDQLVKIYIEKLGDDLMSLLENTKNFSENIGRYFSADDRGEAATANRTARDQGKEIVTSLEEREKEAADIN